MPYTFIAELKGSAYVGEDYRAFCLGEDHRIRLEFEPDNPYDRNAVKVLGGEDGRLIGRLDAASAARIHRLRSKRPTAEAIFTDRGECYQLRVTLEVDPPKKTPPAGIIEEDNVVSGYVVRPAIPAEELRNVSGELQITTGEDGRTIEKDGRAIGMLDGKTSGILDRSDAEIVECRVREFADDRLFVRITTAGHLVTDLEMQRKRIAELFEKMPGYYGCRYGDDPPTENQFHYALALGIDMRDQTFASTSAAIDEAKRNKVVPCNPLEEWETEELYRYLTRANDRRYAFLDGHEDPPRPAKKRPRPEVASEPEPPPVPEPEPPPKYKTECPFCGQHYECPAEMNGTVLKCAHCEQVFRIRIDAPNVPPVRRAAQKRTDASWIVLAIVLILLAIYVVSRF